MSVAKTRRHLDLHQSNHGASHDNVTCARQRNTASMNTPQTPLGIVINEPELRDRRAMFKDRIHATEVLVSMMDKYRGGEALIRADVRL